MTFTKCEKDTNCKNSCLLVMDANFLFYLTEALINNIENEYESEGRNKKFAVFKTRLSNTLNTFASCSLNKKFIVSEKVYEYEILPTNNSSTLRRTINSFNKICNRLNRNFKLIEEEINNYFEITSIDDNEVNEFRNFFGISNRPTDRDATLLLLGLKKAHSVCDTLLLTDDNRLLEAFKYLNNMHTVTLSFGKFNTNRYYSNSYLSFITIAHDCCHLCSSNYINFFLGRINAEIKRKETLNNKIKSIIQKNFEKAYYKCKQSIRLKQKSITKV